MPHSSVLHTIPKRQITKVKTRAKVKRKPPPTQYHPCLATPNHWAPGPFPGMSQPAPWGEGSEKDGYGLKGVRFLIGEVPL